MDFVRDNPGEPVPEETFTHSHLSWSSIPYLLPPSNTIHGIFPVQSTCLIVFFHNLSTFSLVYLLAWHPPLHTPYISSPNHCPLFATLAYFTGGANFPGFLATLYFTYQWKQWRKMSVTMICIQRCRLVSRQSHCTGANRQLISAVGQHACTVSVRPSNWVSTPGISQLNPISPLLRNCHIAYITRRRSLYETPPFQERSRTHDGLFAVYISGLLFCHGAVISFNNSTTVWPWPLTSGSMHAEVRPYGTCVPSSVLVARAVFLSERRHTHTKKYSTWATVQCILLIMLWLYTSYTSAHTYCGTVERRYSIF